MTTRRDQLNRELAFLKRFESALTVVHMVLNHCAARLVQSGVPASLPDLTDEGWAAQLMGLWDAPIVGQTLEALRAAGSGPSDIGSWLDAERAAYLRRAREAIAGNVPSFLLALEDALVGEAEKVKTRLLRKEMDSGSMLQWPPVHLPFPGPFSTWKGWEQAEGRALWDWEARVEDARERVKIELSQMGEEGGAVGEAPGGPAGAKRFRVALSFPGERREFVQAIADHLAEKIGRERVLYDKYHEAEFARPNLDTHLQGLYHDQSELIAVFLCADYERKEWPGLEWRAIRDLIKRRESSAIMPFRFDNTEIPGLLSIDGYIDLAERSPEDVAALILKRLEANPPAQAKDRPSRRSRPAKARPIARKVPKSLRTNRGMAEGRKYHAFISYRHGDADEAFARRVLQTVEAAGFKAAIDERDFDANATFLEEMERCTRESEYTLAVLSSRYLESGNTHEEAIICKVLDMAERKRRLVPLIIEKVERPVWLYSIVGIDFTKTNPLVDPFERLKQMLAKSP